MLFGNVGRKDLAYQMLQKAAQIAENDDNKESLHADIYSDMCAYESSSQKKSFYSRKVLTIYESLQAHGQDYSPNSYAMTLYNASIISMEQSEYKTAMEYVKKYGIFGKSCCNQQQTSKLMHIWLKHKD